ncbi:MAG: hypothetical protein HY655_12185 [Acidobacteria bacterium]|nr:hypothetical protein [Acidobacteriota bacterium]
MTAAPQHAALSAERWAQFSFDDQILMIANEMNRAMHLIESGTWEHVHRCYERILQLVDLTVAGTASKTRRREALRWRDLIASLYLDDRPSLETHQALFKCLLRFTPAASGQISVLFHTDVC